MSLRTFTGTVVDKKHLTDSVILLSFKVPEDFTFKAGQFVSIKIIQAGETKLKSYSIFSPPSQKGRLDFCIKLIEGGFASSSFEKTQKGDEFEFKGPMGFFTYEENDPSAELWFLGAGTGVAPFYSMLKEYLATTPQKKFTLVFGVRTQKDLFYHREFQEWQGKYPHFFYIPTLTREEWSGAQGRVQNHLPVDVQNKTFYICGLKELVLETKEFLMAKGVDPKKIKSERYN